MLSAISLWMEDHGFFSEELITNSLKKMSVSERDIVRTELNQLLGPASQADEVSDQKFSSFDFVASSSFRGERCCSHPDCRMKKAPQVFAFGALYAERLYLPLDTGFPGDDVYLLAGSLRMLHFNRPLIDSGIVKPSLGGLQLCEEHRDEFFGGYLKQAAHELAKIHAAEFSVTVFPSLMRKRKGHRICVSGPRDYLETTFTYFTELPTELARQLSKPTTLHVDEILRNELLDHVFFPSMKDLYFQMNGKRYGAAAYLSDLASETEFFRAARMENDDESWKMAVLQNLNHSIPVFGGIPTERLFGIRQDEEEAFRNYRNAVAKAIRLAPTGGDPAKVAKNIWEQQIRPEVDHLQSRAKLIRKNFRHALAYRAIPSSMIVGVGLFGSRIPAALAHAIQILAGCSLVQGMSPSSQGNVEQQLGAEDYYFLLRATEAA